MDVESSVVDTSESSIIQQYSKLNDYGDLFEQFDILLASFQTRAHSIVNRIMETKREKENVEQSSTWTITLTDSGTQTCDALYRRWNSDLSLEQDAKASGKRYPFCVSTDMVQTPIIHLPAQTKTATKTKFTNKLDVWSHTHKRHTDNMLLSDLGLTNQPPDFSQSEFNLSSEDHWLKENPKTGGRVRFLSHDDGQSCLNHQNQDNADETDIGLRSEQFFHSGSWMTLTQSERDFSEIDSCLSLNYADRFTDSKPFTSTPCKSRCQLKQSVSFHGKQFSNYLDFALSSTLTFSFRFAAIEDDSEPAKHCQIVKSLCRWWAWYWSEKEFNREKQKTLNDQYGPETSQHYLKPPFFSNRLTI